MKIGVLGYIHSGDQNSVRIGQALALQQHNIELFSFSDPDVVKKISKKKLDVLLVTMGREFDHQSLAQFRDKMLLVQWVPDEYGPSDAPGGLWFNNLKGVYHLLMLETKGIVEPLKPFADHVEWIPQYFDNVYHASPTKRDGLYLRDLVFMGGANPDNSSIRLKFLESLVRDSHRLTVFGSGWGKSSLITASAWGGKWIVNGEMTANYRKSKIGLNFINDNLPQYELGFSNRVMKTIGAGCFLLTHKIVGMDIFLKDGEHYVSYDPYDLTDFKAKIEYYLTHDEERERIASAGCDYVLKHYNIAKVTAGFIELIERYKNEQKN
jgi:hypothetical protein